MIFTTTVKHFLVAITNDGICCLNTFIIRYIASCPNAFSSENTSTSVRSSEYSVRQVRMGTNSKVRREKESAMRQVYLLMVQYRSMAVGLTSALIAAWKSARKPSPKRETVRSKHPKTDMDLSLGLDYSCLNELNMRMPAVTIHPIQILLLLNFNLTSLTLVQHVPTKITDSRLHDFTITTAGKEATITASLYVHMFTFTISPHTAAFLQGISIGSVPYIFVFTLRTASPMRAQISWGKKVKMIG